MWGVTFKWVEDTEAVFEVAQRDGVPRLYRVETEGSRLSELVSSPLGGKAVTIADPARPKDIEAILPKSSGWTYRDFVIAMAFFDEGRG